MSEREQEPTKKWYTLTRGRRQLLAFLLVVSLGVGGFWAVGEQRKTDKRQQEEFNRSRCEASRDNRLFLRAIINAIDGLARGIAVPQRNAPPPSKEQQEQIDSYLKRVDKFRSNSELRLKPSPECAVYKLPEYSHYPTEVRRPMSQSHEEKMPLPPDEVEIVEIDKAAPEAEQVTMEEVANGGIPDATE